MSDKRIANHTIKGTAMILDFFKRRRRRQIAWHEGHEEGLRAMRASVGRALGLEPDGVNNKREGVWRYSSILDAIDQLRAVEQRAGERAYRAESRVETLDAGIDCIAKVLGLDGEHPFIVAVQAADRLHEMEERADAPAPTMPLTEDGERVEAGDQYYAVKTSDGVHLSVRFHTWRNDGTPEWIGPAPAGHYQVWGDHEVRVFGDPNCAIKARKAMGGGA